MADHDSIVSSDKLEAIADAIREKTHKNDLMTLDEMPDEIASISGGGDTPTCGVVPTSWSSTGYVLSVDTYGNIPSGAFRSSNTSINPRDYNPYSTSYTLDDFLGYDITYLYLKNVTFQTIPQNIGSCAFEGNYWTEISELPEGLLAIGSYSFYDAYNVTIDEIPSTVTYIGNNAFQSSYCPQDTVPYYSDTQTYHVGDVIVGEGGYFNICIEDILVPESFDSNKWAGGSTEFYGWWDNFAGIYNPAIQYSFKDTVAVGEYRNICTMLYATAETKFTLEYCPDISGYYNPNTHYALGDVIIYETSDSYYDRYPITCLGSTSGEFDLDYWVYGDHPTILGKYDNTRTYNIGDIVAIYYQDYHPCGNYKPVTCVVPVTTPEDFDSNKWVEGGYNEILGIYDNQSTYSFGDTVIYSGIPYTCVIPITTPENFNSSKWCDGYYPELIEIYDSSHTYNAGDVVAYKPNYYITYGPWSCWKDGSTGNPYDDWEHWTQGYYPGIENDVWTYTGEIHVGDVMHDSRDSGGVTVVVPRQDNALIPVPGNLTKVKEQFDDTHSYIAGDIVYFPDDQDVAYFQYFICKSPTYITGEFDSQYWDSLNSDEVSTVKILKFLGTPETIESSAFSDTNYTMLIVPWSEGDISNAPWGFSGTIIYDYTPEQSEL